MRHLLDSLSILKQFRPADHVDIAGALNNIGNVYRELGELDKALENEQRALAMYKQVGLPSIHPDIADCIQHIAFIHHDREEYEIAQKLYEEALAIRQKCQLPTHPDIASNLNDLGYLLCDAEKIDEGFAYFEKAYNLRIANEAVSPIDLADSLNNMGVVNRHRGNPVTAIDFYSQALSKYEAILPIDHALIRKTRNNLQLAQELALSIESNPSTV